MYTDGSIAAGLSPLPVQTKFVRIKIGLTHAFPEGEAGKDFL